jgi:DNA invertase Pin-like site-specific DNA recombinase
MRCAIYARCSTVDQHAEIQIEALRAYAVARGFLVVGEHVDNGVSGAQSRRPALNSLIASARRRDVDAVVVTKLDRLARSMRDLVGLSGELEALGVDLIVTDQALDTSTPAGKLLFHVLGSIAEFELDLIRERTRSGVEAARRRGQRLGRPPALDRRGRERLERLRRSGRSIRWIADALGVSASTVQREVAALKGAQRVPETVDP